MERAKARHSCRGAEKVRETKLRSIAVAILLLTLSAGAAMAQPTPEERQDIIAACEAAMGLPQGSCPCVADKAEESVPPKYYSRLDEFIPDVNIAFDMMNKGEMSTEDVMAIVMYVSTAPAECAVL
jgi:hypothetical protein